MTVSRLFSWLIIFYACHSSLLNAQELVVVVNPSNDTRQMTRSEVIDLFMGKYVAFPDGSKAVAVDLNKEQQSKKEFYQRLLGRSLASVNAYWSRLKFTGRVKPPVSLSSEEEVIQYIKNTPNAIGYIPKSMLTNNLKVVYQFHE